MAGLFFVYFILLFTNPVHREGENNMGYQLGTLCFVLGLVKSVLWSNTVTATLLCALVYNQILYCDVIAISISEFKDHFVWFRIVFIILFLLKTNIFCVNWEVVALGILTAKRCF